MKRTKRLSIMLLCTILMSVSLVAQNPIREVSGTSRDIEEAFITHQLDNLKKDIELTDTQEIEVTKLLQELFRSREQSKLKVSKQQQYSIKKLSNEVYTASLDSVLRQEQRNLLKVKTEERKLK